MEFVHLDFSPDGQCPAMFCILDVHDGDMHVDSAGTTWDEITGDVIYGHDGE